MLIKVRGFELTYAIWTNSTEILEVMVNGKGEGLAPDSLHTPRT